MICTISSSRHPLDLADSSTTAAQEDVVAAIILALNRDVALLQSDMSAEHTLSVFPIALRGREHMMNLDQTGTQKVPTSESVFGLMSAIRRQVFYSSKQLLRKAALRGGPISSAQNTFPVTRRQCHLKQAPGKAHSP